MKALKQICIAFLIMIVAVSAVTAQTENKDLPSEKELRSFIDGIDASDNYLSYITELSQTEHPTWKWDLWSDRVSFYYCDSGSSKGYGSIYLDSTGNEVAPSYSGSCKLVKSYIGEFEADVDESEIEDEEGDSDGELSLVTPLTVSAQTFPVNNNLHWSGITWHVPATHSNTWVDDQNNLHMKLEKINDRWCGSLLESRNTVKYGKFTWVVSSPSLNLERNTTIGLFLYHDDRNELDIEINQWPGTDQHLYFVNQPGSDGDHPENISYGVFSSNPHLNDKNIVYSIEWTPDYVYYSATAEDGTVILDWTYSNPEGIPAINSTICMDILPLAGSYYPVSGNAAEIVLRSFTYTPYDSSWTEPKQKPVASAHTINMFKTVDEGYVFIDRTSDGSKNGAEDFGDCIAEVGMDGYTITSIENQKLTTTRELPGETQFSYYW